MIHHQDINGYVAQRGDPEALRLILRVAERGASAQSLRTAAWHLIEVLGGLAEKGPVDQRLAASSKPSSTPVGDPFLAGPIDQLDLGVRTSNSLRATSIHSVWELIRSSETAVLRMPNMGRRGLREIQDALAARGYLLGMRIPGLPVD